jgi:hypothetical protein
LALETPNGSFTLGKITALSQAKTQAAVANAALNSAPWEMDQ